MNVTVNNKPESISSLCRIANMETGYIGKADSGKIVFGAYRGGYGSPRCLYGVAELHNGAVVNIKRHKSDAAYNADILERLRTMSLGTIETQAVEAEPITFEELEKRIRHAIWADEFLAKTKKAKELAKARKLSLETVLYWMGGEAPKF